jgi:hypothetical protein
MLSAITEKIDTAKLNEYLACLVHQVHLQKYQSGYFKHFRPAINYYLSVIAFLAI